ncbi:MAG: type II toxin-antitoxin system VapC family toxin [Myxococcales bacterium]|nr:type II toxin-antitoxin system VapC family toxin [Myxococcales bacterium]
MKLLLDTHVWLWAHLEPAKLAPRVAAALVAPTNELWLSPISIWEVLLLIERGRVVVRGDPRAWVEAAWARAPMQEAVLTRAVAERSRAVRVAHQDPADRFLAASAEVYDLTLVTDDENLLCGTGYRRLANRRALPRRSRGA